MILFDFGFYDVDHHGKLNYFTEKYDNTNGKNAKSTINV